MNPSTVKNKRCAHCDEQTHVGVIVEEREFWRCTVCQRLSAAIGATVTDPAAFRKAVALADARPQSRDNRLDVVAIVAALIFTFLVAWNSGGAR